MIYCLDTDTCVFALRGGFPAIKRNFQRLPAVHIKIPAIVRAELLLGALKATDPKKTMHTVESFLEPFDIIEFGAKESITYATVRFELERGGFSIGPNDLIIAAIVLSAQATLVTHNIKEFKRVPGLMLEDWID